MNWFDKYHIIRRLLIAFYSYFLLRITYNIFCTDITVDVFKVSIYVSFSGIITFMLKFYFDSRNIEIKGKLNKDKREDNAESSEIKNKCEKK